MTHVCSLGFFCHTVPYTHTQQHSTNSHVCLQKGGRALVGAAQMRVAIFVLRARLRISLEDVPAEQREG